METVSKITSQLKIKLFAFMFIFIASVFLAAYFAKTSVEYSLVRESEIELESSLRINTFRLLDAVEQMKNDLRHIAGMSPVVGILRASLDADQSAYGVWRSQQARNFLNRLTINKGYFQIRILDSSGMELLRADKDLTTGLSVVIEDDKLQNKGDRYYFSETIMLPRNSIYISPVDLNMEGSPPQVIEPIIPTIRFAAPIYIEEISSPQGIIIVNYLSDVIFDSVHRPENMNISIVSSSNQYLLHADPMKCWAGILPEHVGSLFLDEPTIAPHLRDTDVYAAYNKDESHIHGVSKVRFDSEHLDRYWILYQSIDDESVFHTVFEHIDDIFIVGLFICFAMIIISLFMLRDINFSARKIHTLTNKNLFAEAVLDNDSDFIAVAKQDGSVLYVNKGGRKMLGIPQDEDLSHTSISDYHTPEFYDLLSQHLPHFSSSVSWTGTGEFVHRNGTIVPTSMVVMSFSNTDGEHFFATISRDITDEVRVLDALHKAQELSLESAKVKDRFFAMMSHEIRTPMNGVIGLADLLSVDETLSSENLAFIEAIKSSGHALLSIINDILDFSKIDSGNMQLEVVRFDIHEIVSDVSLLFLPLLDSDKVVISASVQDNVSHSLMGDSTRIRQIISNLVGNAQKFTSQGSISIRVSCVSDSPTVQKLMFEVLDTGPGVSEDKVDAIFDPFIQADSSDTRKYGGTGLGLSICKQFIELMDGAIGIKSTDCGANFWFTLDLNKCMDAVVLPEPQDDATSSSQLHFLVADDDAVNRHVASAMLRNLGHTHALAANGVEAVESCEKERFDMILMDMSMPIMDGCEATQRIRTMSSSYNHATPIIAVTANTSDFYIDKCHEAGMNDFIFKPYTKDSLARVIDQWIVNK